MFTSQTYRKIILIEKNKFSLQSIGRKKKGKRGQLKLKLLKSFAILNKYFRRILIIIKKNKARVSIFSNVSFSS